MRRERERPWPLPLPLLPPFQRRGHNLTDSATGRFCTLCQRPGAHDARLVSWRVWHQSTRRSFETPA